MSSLNGLSPALPSPRNTPSAPRAAAGANAEFSYNPQDAFVMPASSTVVRDVRVRQGRVQTGNVKLEVSLPPENDRYVFATGDGRWTAANAFASVANTAATFESYLGQPIRWAFGGSQLGVTPNAGQDLNAYYSRQDGGLFFFQGSDPVTRRPVFSGNSGEITGHETGHAILDALRPGYLQTWSPDPGGFHESFGDVLALFTGLRDDAVVSRVLEQTGGDLRKPNAAAALGEEMGRAINHAVGKNVTGGDWTRNAINQFKWQDPKSLPQQGGPDQLTPEAHNWSRLWTGAMYDVLRGIVAENLAAGQMPAEALKNAAGEGLQMYADLLRTTAPEGDFTYRDMANALIRSQNQNQGGKHADLLRKVMRERQILPATQPFVQGQLQSPPTGSSKLTIQLQGPEFGKFSGATVSTLLSGQNQALFQDTEERSRLEADLARLIQAGQIKWTEPNQSPSPKDLFNEKGQPYLGVVRWTEGQPTIERLALTS